MKKEYSTLIILLILFIITFMGCAQLNVPTDPNDPGGPVPDAIVIAQVMYQNAWGMEQEAFVVTITDAYGNTKTGAQISIHGPNGLVGVPATGGVLIYMNISAANNFVPDSTYYVSITSGADYYIGSFQTLNDVIIAGDGSTVTWDVNTDQMTVTVTDPAMNMQMFGPYLANPFDLNAAGVYSAGAGTYSISASYVKTAASFITATGVESAATVQSQISVNITK